MSRTFEIGQSYQFVACIDRKRRFRAVVASRTPDGNVSLVRPKELLQGHVRVVEGREMVLINSDGLDYTASAVTGAPVAVAAEIVAQTVRGTR